jgi:hypothetical protein
VAENERLRPAIITGSIRKGRFGHVAAEWLASRARLRPDFDVDVIDLATAWLPDVMSADPSAPRPQAVKDLAPSLEAADAFVVVTPEHNHLHRLDRPEAAPPHADPGRHGRQQDRRRRGPVGPLAHPPPERADAGEQPIDEEKAIVRGQTGFAAQLAKEAVEILHNAGGGSVIRRDVHLQRFHRDIQGFSLHALADADVNLELQGRVLVGLEPGTVFL